MEKDLHALFSLNLGSELKNISVQSNADDHGRLKTLTQDSGLTQGQVLHLFLNLIDLRSNRPGLEELQDNASLMSKLERFLLLSALDFGLLTREQLNAVIIFAKHGGVPQSALRIEAILGIMKSNLENQEHFFDQ